MTENQTNRPTKIAVFGGLIAIVAGITAILKDSSEAKKGWCDTIGLFCAFEVKSVDIFETVSPGTPCNNGVHSYCVSATTKYRELDETRLKFEPKKKYGSFNDGDEKKYALYETGWWKMPSKTPATQQCATVYARTGGCENKYNIQGNLVSVERVSFMRVLRSLWP